MSNISETTRLETKILAMVTEGYAMEEQIIMYLEAGGCLNSLLVAATRTNNEAVVNQLMAMEVDPNVLPVPLGPHDRPIYPLCWATFQQDLPTTLILLLHGADPNVQNGACLHFAVHSQNLELVKMLVDYGADPSGPHYDVLTSARLNTSANGTAIVSILEEAIGQVQDHLAEQTHSCVLRLEKVPDGFVPLEEDTCPITLEHIEASDTAGAGVCVCSQCRRKMKAEALAQWLHKKPNSSCPMRCGSQKFYYL